MEITRAGPSGEAIDTHRHRALGSASRAAILRLARATGAGLTAGEVAEHAGLHLSTARAHLDRLVEAGLLAKARASAGLPGRPAWRYRAAAPEPAPAPYRALAAALLEQLATAGDGTQAVERTGRAWGRQLATTVTGNAGHRPEPIESVVTVLDQLGFAPRCRPPDDGDQPPGDSDTVEVHLHSCPFLELVDQHPDVMCGLHAGAIQGALHAAGAPDGEVVLEPFAAPTACVARLRLPATPNGGRQ